MFSFYNYKKDYSILRTVINVLEEAKSRFAPEEEESLERTSREDNNFEKKKKTKINIGYNREILSNPSKIEILY